MAPISEITDDGGDPTLKPIFDRQHNLSPRHPEHDQRDVRRSCARPADGAGDRAVAAAEALLPLIYLRVASINGLSGFKKMISIPSVWRKPKAGSTRSRKC